MPESARVTVLDGRWLPASLARRRAIIREHVKDILEEIDIIARTLV